MFKSVFSKYFSVISLIIVCGFLAMSAFQILFSTRVWVDEKRTLLTENAENIAHQTALNSVEIGHGETGEAVYYLDQGRLSPVLSLVADAVDSTVLISNRDGKVLLCTDRDEYAVLGKTVSSDFMREVGDGNYFGISTLGGLLKERQYVSVSPVVTQGRAVGYVMIYTPTDAVKEILASNLRVYLLSAMGALILCFAVVYLLTWRFVRPLREMASATRRFASGDFSARVTVRGKDEVAQLGDALNHMATSLSSVEGMRRSFIANVSHELKTPMTTIAGFVDGILDGTVPPEKQAYYLKIVSDEVKRLSRLVRSMLDLSRIDSGELKMKRTRVDLTEIVGSVLISSEQRIESKNITVTGMEDCEPVEMAGDYDWMNQVLYNLLDNAIKFTNEGGCIDIRLQKADGRAVCTIRNTGAGIPASEMPQIFERFYKSDRSRSLDKNGMGLGLYIVRTVIDLHGGEVTVRSVEGEFTEFAFWVPVPAELPGENIQTN